MKTYLFLTDPMTAFYAGFIYLVAMYVAGRTLIKAYLDTHPIKRPRVRSVGRHVSSEYIPRWSTPTTPRHKALTDAPERYLATWDTAPIKVITPMNAITQPIPVAYRDNAHFVQMVGQVAR